MSEKNPWDELPVDETMRTLKDSGSWAYHVYLHMREYEASPHFVRVKLKGEEDDEKRTR